MKHKNLEEIKEELKNLSPLAMPQYLMNCEFYDKTSSLEILENAIEEFRDKGGVGANFTQTVLVACAEGTIFGCVKKWGSAELKRKLNREKLGKKNISIQSLINRCLDFQYPEDVLSQQRQELMTGGMREYQYAAHPEATSITRENYDRDQLLADNWAGMRDEKWEERAGDSSTMSDEYGGKTGKKIYKNHKDVVENQKIKDDYAHQAELDHVVPLEQFHAKYNQYGHFTERYLSDDKCKELANSESNLKFTNKRLNRYIKNRRTNEEAIRHSEDICAQLKKKLSAGNVSPEERKRLEKKLKNWSLTDDEKQQLREAQKNAERKTNQGMLVSGTGEVGLEQIGRIVEVIIGPVSFEIRDMMKNGICHGLDTDSTIEGLFFRFTRAFKYFCSKLLDLFLNFTKDLAQMLLTFLEGFLSKVCKIFSSLLNVVTRGFSLIIESAKILMSEASAAEKGHAITTLLLSFATGVLGNYIIDMALEYFNVPDPFSDILAAIASTIISSVLIYYFDKLDLFSMKKELMRQRINEVFALRRQQIQEACAGFDLVVSEKLKEDRILFEELRTSINSSLKKKNFEELNYELDKLAKFLGTEIPYKNTEEFISFVRNNSVININFSDLFWAEKT